MKYGGDDTEQMSEDEIDAYQKELSKTDSTLYICNSCNEEFYQLSNEDSCPNCSSTNIRRV